MDAEKKIVFALLAAGAAALAASSLLSSGTNSLLGASAEENLPKILCVARGGERLLSLPPSESACGAFRELLNNPFSEGSCDLLSFAKRSACKQLYALASQRAADCADFLFLNQTSFPQGALQASELCAILEN